MIRLHAVGDVAITIPYCQGLRNRFPSAQIDLLTREDIAPLASALTLFDNVRTFPYCSSRYGRLYHTLRNSWEFPKHGYNIVLDLQGNWITKMIRRSLVPKIWCQFDRYSPLSAADRVRATLHEIGLDVEPSCALRFENKYEMKAQVLLRENGWNEHASLIVLNPAGLWKTRNWQIENYVSLANLWLRHHDTQFIIVGTPRIAEHARYLQEHLGKNLIDLVSKTSLAEAFCLLQYSAAMVTEDSGLMHMAWASGIPTVVLFGSTDHRQSRPIGTHVRCFHSGDLPCGDCGQPTCRYDDVHCLTRFEPHMILETLQQLLDTASQNIPVNGDNQK
ncbi:MAG: glycosyltransferase family 9 protein [Ignavibacteriae bacterium]|nr:glycosyltransferase family 9 protein [Ignavibacteria bacterium]MBI3363664.1 glycosyltransferase family 9 protein [Ignavibacteriota bacterium]